MRMRHLIIAWILLLSVPQGLFGQSEAGPGSVRIKVDLAQKEGEMEPVWAWFGYDEPNYTYMKDGRKLLSEIAALSYTPVYVRTHNLLTSGDGSAALKWGSTNVYTEDQNGNPVYDWTIVDRIFDTYVERGMKPLVEIGFMPEALSIKPEPYRHHWQPGQPYTDIFTGWSYPPKDYRKWAELVHQWVRHSVERYGAEEVATWYWELWNEPDSPYWAGTTAEYCKLYDYTADAVKRALPSARIGGPHVTGPTEGGNSVKFLRAFLHHCTAETNAVTGTKGASIDFIAFHAKGSPRVENGVVTMNLGRQLRQISLGFQTVVSFDAVKGLPVILGESDPEGCAACPVQEYPQNDYRNGTLYSSYTADAISRTIQLADHFHVRLRGAVTWAFEFENQPWFAGFRDLATNGVDKPVLNIFRMFGMMRGNRVSVGGDLAYDALTVRDSSVRGKPDISALATREGRSAAVMIWNYHDANELPAASNVEVEIQGIPADESLLQHFRVDRTHSNSYGVWKEMGSPQHPTAEQIAALERAGQLHLLTSPEWIKVHDGIAVVEMKLPRQGVSLLKLEW